MRVEETDKSMSVYVCVREREDSEPVENHYIEFLMDFACCKGLRVFGIRFCSLLAIWLLNNCIAYVIC